MTSKDAQVIFIEKLPSILKACMESGLKKLKIQHFKESSVELIFSSEELLKEEFVPEQKKQFDKEADDAVAKYELIKQNKRLEDEIADTLHITDPLAYEEALINQDIHPETQ